MNRDDLNTFLHRHAIVEVRTSKTPARLGETRVVASYMGHESCDQSVRKGEDESFAIRRAIDSLTTEIYRAWSRLDDLACAARGAAERAAERALDMAHDDQEG